MAKRDIGQEILDSINEIKDGNVERVATHLAGVGARSTPTKWTRAVFTCDRCQAT